MKKFAKTRIVLLILIAVTLSPVISAQNLNGSNYEKQGGGSSSSGDGQSGYKTGIGLRLGYEGGITLKHFIRSDRALEGIVSRGWGYGGFRITGLYEIQKSFPGAKGLDWFLGLGAHVGFFNGNYYGYYGNNGGGYFDKHGNWHATGYRDYYTTVGLDGIAGLEYQFDEIPITIGLDIKPYFDFIGGSSHYADGAFSVRYIIH